MIVFRHADPRMPFLWEDSSQPPGRWHGQSEGPVHYFADTPDGAWAEFCRHEEITSPEDLIGVRRALWAVEAPEDQFAGPHLNKTTLTGGRRTYAACRREARRIRTTGAPGLKAPSAALAAGAAHGWRVDLGLRRGAARDPFVYALFGERPDLTGWTAAAAGRPSPALLSAVRHFG